MIDANAIRDNVVFSLAVNYDWDTGSHFAEIGISDQHGNARRVYRINGLSDFNIVDGVGDRHIAFCTLLIEPGRTYLSLDPFNEGVESDKDNWTFTGSSIVLCK